MEYHVDGFILNPFVVSMESVHADPFLKNTRLWNTVGIPDSHAKISEKVKG